MTTKSKAPPEPNNEPSVDPTPADKPTARIAVGMYVSFYTSHRVRSQLDSSGWSNVPCEHRCYVVRCQFARGKVDLEEHSTAAVEGLPRGAITSVLLNVPTRWLVPVDVTEVPRLRQPKWRSPTERSHHSGSSRPPTRRREETSTDKP